MRAAIKALGVALYGAIMLGVAWLAKWGAETHGFLIVAIVGLAIALPIGFWMERTETFRTKSPHRDKSP